MFKYLKNLIFIFTILIFAGCSSYHVKVIDQYGEPVPDVLFAVHLSSLSFPLPFAQVNPTKHIYKTDSDGRFTNGQGRLSTLYIEKNGHEFSHEKGFGSSYPGEVDYKGYYTENRNSYSNPYYIMAWKREEPEKLIGRENVYGFKLISNNQYLPLIFKNEHVYRERYVSKNLKSNIKRNAHLYVRFTESNKIVRNRQNKKMHPWELTLTIPQGGLIETDDIFRNVAPKEGYIKTWSVRSVDLQSVSSRIKKNFYFKSHSGNVYGQFTVKFNPRFNVISFKYWLNPNGSRNLTRPKKHVYCTSHHHDNCSYNNYEP